MNSTPAPGTNAVVELTDSGRVVMANAIGPGTLQLEAVVVSANATSWELSMLNTRQTGGGSTRWNREHVTLPYTAVSRAFASKFSVQRTVLASGAIVVGALSAGRAFRVGSGNEKGAGSGTRGSVRAGGR